MIGEIGGEDEQKTVDWLKQNNHCQKPVVAYIAGLSAPKGKRMGHAGAIVSKGKTTAQEKIRYLEQMGIPVSKSPSEIGKLMYEVMREKQLI